MEIKEILKIYYCIEYYYSIERPKVQQSKIKRRLIVLKIEIFFISE